MRISCIRFCFAVILTIMTVGCNTNTSSKDVESEKTDSLATENVDFVKYEDPNTGITFLHLPDWKFERKLRVATGEWEIVGNSPIHGYHAENG